MQGRGFNKVYDRIVHELLTECGVSLPFNPAKGESKQRIENTSALWDTGATNSVITKDLATKLGLKPIREIDSHHAGGTTRVPVYLVNIFLPNGGTVMYVQVSECIETVGRFGILIGMDIISLGDFSISHFAGKTTFSFRIPSMQQIRLDRDCLPVQAKATSTQAKTGNKYPGASRNKPCPCGSKKNYKNCCGQAA
jgi:hypothetical protein